MPNPDDQPYDVCSKCGHDGEHQGDRPTNTGPTAVEPGYVAVYECPDCENVWEV
jgi:hypothetical protein